MSELVIIVIFVLLILAVAALIILLKLNSPAEPAFNRKSQGAVSDALRALVSSQREASKQNPNAINPATGNLAVAAAIEAAEASGVEDTSGRMTLAKKLYYARLPLTPAQFRGIQLVITLPMFIFALSFQSTPLILVALIIGPTISAAWLAARVNKRFKAFDKDYPTLLLSYTSLLKTGMNTLTGLEAAAGGLPPDSAVRAEVGLLLERLRLGLTEDQAINAFGEDVPHPELELFVQSLLLSKRVGGTLSTTLERLAKQVRKRQQFRDKAIAAVGMERGSMYAVAFIMGSLLLYLMFMQPDLILPAFSDPTGRSAVHLGILAIVVGFIWSKIVTNIKV